MNILASISMVFMRLHRHDPKPDVLNHNLPEYKKAKYMTRRRRRKIASLGDLDKLPIETLCSILEQVDLLTLNSVRCLNSHALDIVESIPEYRTLEEHGRDALRAAFCTYTACGITCKQLYDTLCQKACSRCRNPAEYIYMMTCERACLYCLTAGPWFIPRRAEDVRQCFALLSEDIKALPRMTVFPGRYGVERAPLEQYDVVDGGSAMQAGLDRYGSWQNMHAAAVDAEFNKRWAQLTSVRRFTKEKERTTRAAALRAVNDDATHHGDPVRFAAAVSAPWFNTLTKTAEDIEPDERSPTGNMIPLPDEDSADDL